MVTVLMTVKISIWGILSRQVFSLDFMVFEDVVIIFLKWTELSERRSGILMDLFC